GAEEPDQPPRPRAGGAARKARRPVGAAEAASCCLGPSPCEGRGGWEGVPTVRDDPEGPLPNPSGPPAQLACLPRRAGQWLAGGPPVPLPAQGGEWEVRGCRRAYNVRHAHPASAVAVRPPALVRAQVPVLRLQLARVPRRRRHAALRAVRRGAA